VVNFNDTEEFFQKAGLWRLAKACLLESEDFRAAFRQRIPRDAGRQFDEYIAKAIEIEEHNEERLRRLQDAILFRVKSLSEQGALSARWAQLKLNLHDPNFAAQIKNAEQDLGPASRGE
jgi:hypothetical protein